MASINTHDVGDLVRCSGAFTTSAGAATDPAAVFFKYKDPSGNIATLQYTVDAELVKDSTGNYHVDVDADESGTWYYRFYGTGSGQSAGEAKFKVQASEF